MRRIRKGDKVQIISGKDLGRQGAILQVAQRKGDLWVMVEGLNLRRKHVKPAGERPGGIQPKEAFMPACKVALVDPTTGKPSRVGIKLLEDGRKVRYFKVSGEVVDV